MAAIRLLVGLGNPGAEYRDTRHNAGVWLAENWLRHLGGDQLTENRKFSGASSLVNLQGVPVRVLVPATFVNNSGKSVLAAASYFRISPEDILIAHDELDLPPGVVRFKSGGGPGGHNGLKDIIQVLGKAFARVRIGIGHPGHASQVVSHVLSRPRRDEMDLIQKSIENAISAVDRFIAGDRQSAMLQLHSPPGKKTLPAPEKSGNQQA